MIPYTLAQMNSDVTVAFQQTPHSPDSYLFSDPYFAFLKILDLYGFRFNELQKSALFSRLNTTTLQIPLSKNQQFRQIIDTEEQIDRIILTLNYYDFFYYINNSTASRVFNSFMQKRLYLNTGKELTTHFFRHKLCKNLYNQGQTVQQIATYIGEINLNNISGYINSSIFYEVFTP